jgi:hypothetical protein
MNTYKKPLFIHWFYYFSAIISYGIAFILLVVHYYQQSLVMPLGVYFLGASQIVVLLKYM